MKKLFLSIGILVALASHAQVGRIDVNITSLKSNQGNVLISLYRSEDGFPTDLNKVWKSAKATINGSTAAYSFDSIPFGIYAISISHDENNNGKIDTNFMGIPKEGVGTSNNAKGSFGPPKFSDAKFKHSKAETQIEIKVSY